MGITIHKIVAQVGKYSLVELTHGREELVAKVWDEDHTLAGKLGVPNLLVEMNYDQLVKIERIKDFNDFDSKICQQEDNYIIKGRVIQIIEMENDFLIDVYLQIGPEFLSILTSEIGDIELTEGQGVEVELTDLAFFPTNTKY